MRLRHTVKRREPGPFPCYGKRTPCKTTTIGRLALAKSIAVNMFRAGAAASMRKFRRSMSRRYKCKPSAVTFEPLAGPTQRIRRAVLVSGYPHLYAQTDGYTIEVSDAPMTFKELVGSLVHEALHSWCMVRGKWVPEAPEHHVMRALGDAL